MTRKETQTTIKNTCKTVVLVIISAVLGLAFGWLGYSYRYTDYGMEQCKADGRSNCHVEWDGFETGFSVYGN